MGKSRRGHSTKSSGSSRDSHRSNESHNSQSTAPTSPNSSPRPSRTRGQQDPVTVYKREDISPVTSCYDRSSVETFNSAVPTEDEMADVEMESQGDYQDFRPRPVYRHDSVDSHVRPSNPQDFARHFPSMDRLAIRHDEFTPDGN